MSYLVIIDRAYRGSAEAQFFDAFYGIRTIGNQLGGVELVLRGSAVTAAVDAPPHRPTLQVGTLTVDTVPDHRASIRAILAAGTAVYVDQPGLAAIGLECPALIPGVHCLDTSELADRWADSDGVWFL